MARHGHQRRTVLLLGETAPPAGPLGVLRLLLGRREVGNGGCASCQAPGLGETEPPAGPLCFAVLHRPCFVCMVWGRCPCAFFLPCRHCTGVSMSPLPLFYILSFPLVLPEPCKCVHSVPPGVCVPPPRPECSRARPPRTLIHPARLSLPLCSLRLADLVTLYRTLFIMVLSFEGSDPLGPPFRPQLV